MKSEAVTNDLITKVADDVGAAIKRVVAIAPQPHLPIVMAAAAAALGATAAVLAEIGGVDCDEPPPDLVQLAGLLAARMCIARPHSVEDAYRDFDALKAAGRAALGEKE